MLCFMSSGHAIIIFLMAVSGVWPVLGGEVADT
jgi:hypothetical protein